jgi:segregation and condensation protein B
MNETQTDPFGETQSEMAEATEAAEPSQTEIAEPEAAPEVTVDADEARPDGTSDDAADEAGEEEPPVVDEISQAHAHALALRTLEAVLFATPEPMDTKALAKRLPSGADVTALLAELEAHYANRGINLVRVAGKYAFRTAPDLGSALQIEVNVPRKLSRAAIETLSIIAYHQPVTRAEIEEIRGVALSRGTLDALMEAGWIQPKGHRETPGHPATWVTTEAFLSHFGLNSTKDLPGMEELKAAGLLDARPAVSAYSDQGKLGTTEPEAGTSEEDEAGLRPSPENEEGDVSQGEAPPAEPRPE